MNFIRSGFRTVRHNPALIFAEIAWRWAFGAAAWIIVILTIRTIMAGIDVSQAEVALTRSNDAYLIADAIVRVIVQVIPRFAAALVILIPVLALIWIVAATIGRAITLRCLFDPSQQTVVPRDAARSGRDATPQRRTYAVRIGLLNVLRAIFSIATLLAFFGTIFLVSAQLNPSMSPATGPALIFGWMCLAVVVAFLWGVVNWFLALAAIFIVRDAAGVWRSISDSLRFYRDNRAEYARIATMFGLIRTAALVVAFVAGAMTIAAGSLRAVLVASIVVGLVYVAVADFLYIARLAAYVELSIAPAAGAPLPVTGPVDPASPAPPNLELET